jgi:hypothetical protein
VRSASEASLSRAERGALVARKDAEGEEEAETMVLAEGEPTWSTATTAQTRALSQATMLAAVSASESLLAATAEKEEEEEEGKEEVEKKGMGKTSSTWTRSSRQRSKNRGRAEAQRPRSQRPSSRRAAQPRPPVACLPSPRHQAHHRSLLRKQLAALRAPARD